MNQIELEEPGRIVGDMIAGSINGRSNQEPERCVGR
jgi:hypothetical protein